MRIKMSSPVQVVLASLMDAGLTLATILRNVVFTAVLVICISVVYREGVGGLVRKLVSAARLLPGVDEAISWALTKQVKGFLRQVDPAAFSGKSEKKATLSIPKKGELMCVGRGSSAIMHSIHNVHTQTANVISSQARRTGIHAQKEEIHVLFWSTVYEVFH